MEGLCHAERRAGAGSSCQRETASKGCRKGKRTGFVQELFDPVRSPDCQSHMGLAEILDVFREFEMLLGARGSVILRSIHREMESALTLAKSLPTSIRPSLVLILKLLTSLRIRLISSKRTLVEVDAPRVPAQVRHS